VAGPEQPQPSCIMSGSSIPMILALRTDNATLSLAGKTL
jgi:hypothetical protein